MITARFVVITARFVVITARFVVITARPPYYVGTRAVFNLSLTKYNLFLTGAARPRPGGCADQDRAALINPPPLSRLPPSGENGLRPNPSRFAPRRLPANSQKAFLKGTMRAEMRSEADGQATTGNAGRGASFPDPKALPRRGLLGPSGLTRKAGFTSEGKNYPRRLLHPFWGWYHGTFESAPTCPFSRLSIFGGQFLGKGLES